MKVGIRERRFLPSKWAILISVFVLQMLVLGCTTYSFGVFIKPIALEFRIDRSSVNNGLILILTGTGLASPLIGRALDRFSGRWTIFAGSIGFALGATVLSETSRPWLAGLMLFGPIAIGVVSLGPLSTAFLVTRWFADAPTRPLALAGISGSLGGVLIVPLMSFSVAIEGWRTATVVAGWVTGLIGVGLAVLVLRDAPPGSPVKRLDAVAPVWTVRALISNRDFWLLTLTVGILFAINAAVIASLIAYGADRGFSLAQAASLVSGVSLSSIAGKLLLGASGDLFDKRWLMAGASGMFGLFLVALTLYPSFPVLFLICLLTGVATGATLPAWGAMIFTRFGTTSYGLAMGLMLQLQLPLMLAALRFSGLSYDSTKSYDQSFLYFAAVIPVVIVGLLAIGRPGYQKM